MLLKGEQSLPNSLIDSLSRNTRQGKFQSGPKGDKKVSPPVQNSRKGAGATGELRHQLQPRIDSSLDADLGSTAWFSEENYFEGRAGSKCMPVE